MLVVETIMPARASSVSPPDRLAILAAAERLRPWIIETPLLPLEIDGRLFHLKPEMLQPVGSFKLRCAGNALLARLTRDGNRAGGGRFVTASAGNFAQGLAWIAARTGSAVTSIIPETAADSKRDALRRLGATIETRSYADWWNLLVGGSNDPDFVHPVTDPDGLAGNATIGWEIAQALPDVATILVPLGGGGLAAGISAGLRAAGSQARVVACETEAGAPLTASLAAGRPVEVAFDSRTFITGMGSPSLIPAMWETLRDTVAETVVLPIGEVADAVRLLIERCHLVVEGAGAVALAAALRQDFAEPVICLLSGGHLDRDHLSTILDGRVPRTVPDTLSPSKDLS